MADELNEWLRRVRPPTTADDSWSDSDEGQRVLSELQRRVHRVRFARRAKLWTLLPAASIATAAVVVLVVSAVSGSTPAPSRPQALPPLTNTRPAAHLLTPFTSCGAVLSSLRSHAAAHVSAFSYYGNYGLVPYANAERGGAPVAAPEPANGSLSADKSTSGAGTGGGTSTTNVQEIGVDEPDIVKTDGDIVVTVTDGKLHVIDAASRRITGTLDLTMYANAQSAQLLVSGNSAIVILHPSYSGGYYGGPAIEMPAPIRPGGGGTAPTTRSTVLYVDLSGTPKVSGSMQADGDVVDARMVGTTVRLVVSSTPRINPPTYNGGSQSTQSSWRDSVNHTLISAWLPTYSINGTLGSTTKSVPCTQLSYPKDFTAASTLTLYTIDPTKPGADPQPVSLEADGDTVYATSTSLYVASNPNCVYCISASGGASTTEIHRFDITGSGKPTYLGSGSVQGSLLSQYSMSEYNGSLRVATTVYPAQSPNIAPNTAPVPRPASTSNSVAVLDAGTLKETGRVDGLGAGERLYAVRFLGPLGYVVTFNQVDPLYVLDLSDAHHPRTVGSLELNGFSSYLHDVGSGRLVGVGQDTTPVNEGGGVYAHLEGLLVQLFDVSNPSKPTRTSHVTLSNTPGQAEFDPHAFLYWQPTGLIVVPVGTWSPNDMGKVLAVRMSGKTLTQVGLVANRGASGSNMIERSMIVDGSLWTLSPTGIRVSNQTSLAEQSWIDFG